MKTCNLLPLLIAVVLSTGCTDRLAGPSLDTENETRLESVTSKRSSQRFADLSLRMTVDNARPAVDDSLFFKVEIHNEGPARTSGVEVSWLSNDSLLNVLSTEVSTQTSRCCVYNDSLGVWIVGTLPSGATEQLVLVARVIGTGKMTSTAEIIESHLPDLDSVVDNGDATEDDQDSVRIRVRRGRRR